MVIDFPSTLRLKVRKSLSYFKAILVVGISRIFLRILNISRWYPGMAMTRFNSPNLRSRSTRKPVEDVFRQLSFIMAAPNGLLTRERETSMKREHLGSTTRYEPAND